MVTSASTISDLELDYLATNGFDDAYALVTECDAIGDVGEIRGADAGVCDPDEDVLWPEGRKWGGTLLDGAVGTAEDLVLGRWVGSHCEVME